MTDSITLTGLVATDLRHITTSEKLSITSFRLASNQRRYDRATDRWIDGDTNWYTVTTFRQLSVNSSNSIKKGDRVLVTGKLRIREWDSGERKGINIDVEAEAIGHDLGWGTSVFTRTISASPAVQQVEPSSGESSSADSSSAGPSAAPSDSFPESIEDSQRNELQDAATPF